MLTTPFFIYFVAQVGFTVGYHHQLEVINRYFSVNQMHALDISSESAAI